MATKKSEKRLTGVQRKALKERMYKLNREAEKLRETIAADERHDKLPKALARGFKHIGKDGNGPRFDAWILKQRGQFHETVIQVAYQEINLWCASEGKGYYPTFAAARAEAMKHMRRRVRVITDAMTHLDRLTEAQVRNGTAYKSA